ncbi:putative alpha/beta hydrolase family esterase [Novosphingobium capsulatum]|uniref:Alpha/beta hydrolase family esterase n=1 Tax=Novosphingobium capsulatum TaxID=13688 RepID=A0ABU1MG48_9SPHN|nr:alpha/beta hydrolase [Novosphingobium capsulatum]MDR6509303.1 putative alpha/beta hydrolase family esterase [Novosphingobium capsulatum]
MAHEHAFSRTADPIILTVPGLDNSGPDHWQTIWEQTLPDCHRVDLGLWNDPHRNTWVNKLALAIQRAHEGAGRPVVLVAHSLGCLAVAWWAEYERLANGPRQMPVIGALLVAPPDVEDGVKDRRLTRFAPVPETELPFPAIVVGSRDDRYATPGATRRLAQRWGARFADAGAAGHINAQSGLGEWAFGRLLLNRLLPRALSLDDGQATYVPTPRRFVDPALRRLGA